MSRPAARTYHHLEFDADALRPLKGGRTVSVCLPARNEAGDGRRDRRDGPPRAGRRAPAWSTRSSCSTTVRPTPRPTQRRGAGARVASTAELLPEVGPGTGKGEALWKSVFAAEGDLIVWCDADITDFDARFVVGLLGPLLTRPDIGFVKGFYDRPVDGMPGTGGRVTELVARPLISLLYPRLAGIVQPLVGRVRRPPRGARGGAVRAGLRRRPRAAHRRLGPLRHRRPSPRSTSACASTATAPLDELSPQALAVMQTAFTKAHLGLGAAQAATLRAPGPDRPARRARRAAAAGPAWSRTSAAWPEPMPAPSGPAPARPPGREPDRAQPYACAGPMQRPRRHRQVPGHGHRGRGRGGRRPGRRRGRRHVRRAARRRRGRGLPRRARRRATAPPR